MNRGMKYSIDFIHYHHKFLSTNFLIELTETQVFQSYHPIIGVQNRFQVVNDCAETVNYLY